MELIFTKRLTQTDAETRLSWPTKHMNLLRCSSIDLNRSPNRNDEKLEFKVYDIEGRNAWSLTCTTRRTSKFLKPVISGGWTRFIKDNGLCKNDEIAFYKNMDPASYIDKPFFIGVISKAPQG
uniref:TF-B3 domain-containing protein n=1 Tax=Chenopodium quinoa TaxID=63459 RepID=A0A803LWL3_CHEQI